MKTYVLMSKLAPHGPSVIEVVSSVKDGPRSRRLWIEQVKKQCPEVKFTAHYALLGAWDFMDIYEAPDEETAAIVSLLSRSSGAYRVESWVAIPNSRLLEIAEAIESSCD